MCLVIDRKYHNIFLRPKTSKTAIRITKVLQHLANGTFITPSQRVKICFNDEGFLKLQAKLGVSKKFKRLGEITKAVSTGIHGYTYFDGVDWTELCPTYFYHPAIIPANTKYYLGIKNEIVAEEMIIFKDKESYDAFIKKNHCIEK